MTTGAGKAVSFQGNVMHHITLQQSIAHGGRRRRGLILVVVLVMVALLSLLAASYTFMVSAHLKTVIAQTEQFQARMAAEAGIQRAIATLRETPGDVDSWFDNPDSYHGALVWGREGNEGSATFQERSDARTYDSSAEPAWRFSLYGPNFDEPRDARYGFTDEAPNCPTPSPTGGRQHGAADA